MSDNLANPWFNDRRIIFNGPRRLRDNLSQILNNLNQQTTIMVFNGGAEIFLADFRKIMHENPELITQLSDQLQRLNDVLHGRANNVRRHVIAERGNRRAVVPLPVAPLNSSSNLSAINRTLSDDLGHAMNHSPSSSVTANQESSTRTHRRYTDGSIDRFPSSVNSRFDFDSNDSTVVSIEVDRQQTGRIFTLVFINRVASNQENREGLEITLIFVTKPGKPIMKCIQMLQYCHDEPLGPTKSRFRSN
uniref:Uncharacterized protein n=1 Tax=Romanomermis culicivorax TaxID=13658 RepID=A0A915KV11_ROMCU